LTWLDLTGATFSHCDLEDLRNLQQLTFRRNLYGSSGHIHAVFQGFDETHFAVQLSRLVVNRCIQCGSP
jgi:uncharacterized protein YjbI with pentapeptide repeats